MAVDVAALLAAQRALDPLVIDLARALSVATRIETTLVRHMRLELFPDSDAGLEANLWFSTLVADRDMLGVSLIPECRDELRRQLTLPEHRQTLELAWRVIVNCHRPADAAGVPPVINVQEATTYHALAAAAYGSASHRQSMQEGLGTLMKGLSEDSDGALTEWIVRSLPALPAAARQSSAAIALAERVRARDATAVLEGVPRVARDASGRPSIDWALNTVAVGIQRRTDGIELTVPPAAGAHIFHVPNTAPLAIAIQSPTPEGWQTRSIDFEPLPRQVIADPTPASVCRFTTASGQRLTVQPIFGETRVTLDVWMEGVDPSSLNDIPEQLRAMCGELGWNLRWPAANLPFDSDPAAALFYLGEASAFTPPSPIVPVIAWARDRLEPVEGGAALTLTLEHESSVLSAEFSPDATRIVTGGDGSIRVWDASTGDLLQDRPLPVPSRAASFSPDGKSLLLASNDGTVTLWPLDRPDPSVFGTHEDWVMSAEFGASGTTAVTASQDSTAAIWNVESGAKRIVLRHDGAVNHASFSPDESRVATASDDQTAAVWSVDGRKLATLTHEADVRSVQWSPDGLWLLTADADGNAWLWSASTFARDRRPFQHDFEIHFATFSSDGRRIAVATSDGIAWVWHLPSRALLVPGLQAPIQTGQSNIPVKPSKRPRSVRLQAVYSVAFSPDGQRVLTGGASGRAHVWDVSTAAPSNSVARRTTLRRMEFAPPAPEIVKGMKESLRAQLLALDERRLLWWTAHSPSVNEAAAHDPNPAAVSSPAEEPTPAQSTRPTIFVSYNHKDEEWFERLERVLAPVVRSQDIEFLTSEQIGAGAGSEAEIDAAMARAAVIIILVTPSYLASDYAIRELTRLADTAQSARSKIVWVPLRASNWDETPLSQYQAITDPSQPWSKLNRPAQDAAMTALVERVQQMVGATPDEAQTAGANPGSRIFLCYRRGRDSGRAGRLRDRLTDEFGESDIFLDVSTLRPGVDFAEVIAQAVSAAAVMLVIIGPQWLEERDADGRRRIDSEQDWMRMEVSLALRSNVTVIPVLVEGASMPRASALPSDLRGLARRQAIELADDRWEYDVRQLIDAMRSSIGDTLPDSKRAATPRRPIRIYLSSTHTDLKEHRERVVGALRRVSEFVIVNEPTLADERGPVQRELQDLASADLMILIVALRYGYVPDDKQINPERLSMTELAF
ncbi:MAG TPA: TIR domain-containing protein, partial [Candidatus Limnocylindrales bacterium]|nr:TIR domain-containing protein [Candidatus Limnocylindrales bacterium]